MNIFNKKGFTLIEVIVSITLLGIIAMFILPMSMYGVKFSKWNNIKLNALNLAHTQIEWLKTYDYEKLGLNKLGYEPYGDIDEYKYMNEQEEILIENVEYKMYTNIYWVDSESTTGEPVPDALKGIDVIVEAKDLYSGKIKRYSVLETIVTREGERNPSEPGQLTVYTYFRDMNTIANRVEVKLNNGLRAYSNIKGKALFANLNARKYIVKPLTWKGKEIIAQPNSVDDLGLKWIYEEIVEIKDWKEKDKEEFIYPELSFYIDFPGYIVLSGNNNYPNAEVIIGPSTDSYNPPEGIPSDYLFLTTTIGQLEDFKFWRLWEYEYEIKYGEDIYFLVDKDKGSTWDKTFKTSNIEEPTYEKLELGFGLVENGTFKLSAGKIEKINLKFTSKIENIYDMEFTVNGQSIDKGNYNLKQNNNNITVEFDSSLNAIVNNNEIDFEITNGNILINQYNMKLATDLNKSTLSQEE